MPTVCDNGIFREATQEEIEEMQAMDLQFQNRELTPEEEIKELQEQNEMLIDILDNLLTEVLPMMAEGE